MVGLDLIGLGWGGVVWLGWLRFSLVGFGLELHWFELGCVRLVLVGLGWV